MNKAIQYREDGKFYLLDKPGAASFEDYAFKLKACIAAGKEIINPEVLRFSLGVEKAWKIFDKRLIKPGDIFDCPDNIEFEERLLWVPEELKSIEVIRLKLKEEVKTEEENALKLLAALEVKEESQDELWSEIVLYVQQCGNAPARWIADPLKSKFTIQRNKNI